MKNIFVVALLFACSALNSQELYPNSEPASVIPKNTIGVRLMNEAYKNKSDFRAWNGAMFMYGVGPKLMFNAMLTASNHHDRQLQSDFLQDDTNHGYTISNSSVKSYSYLFESVNLGFRYRFVNRDGDHKHFRMALYGNGVYADRPHDEAEVSLMGDNKGVGGGLISTVLVEKLAVSFTGGIIKPFAYNRNNISLKYGDAYNYSLSFGYLLFPFRYKNYQQTNVNLYAEFLGKSYSKMTIEHNGKAVDIKDHATFNSGNYVEFRPAVQFIVRSNLRIDLSTALPLINRSYIRQYPMYLFNLQYYFFL